MERHLHLVPAGADLDEVDAEEPAEPELVDTNVVDLDDERLRRRRYHPAAGLNWIDRLFDDDDDDPLDPVC